MGFAQIRRLFFFLEGGRGDGGQTRQQTYVENHLTAANCLYYLASGGFAPVPYRGSAPGPRWGTSVPRLLVPTLTSEPGYTAWRKANNNQSNLAIGGIVAHWGFLPPNLPFLWGTGFLSNYLGPHECPCEMASHSVKRLLAGCTSVTDDIQTDRPRCGNTCRNLQNRFQRCRLKTCPFSLRVITPWWKKPYFYWATIDVLQSHDGRQTGFSACFRRQRIERPATCCRIFKQHGPLHASQNICVPFFISGPTHLMCTEYSPDPPSSL